MSLVWKDGRSVGVKSGLGVEGKWEKWSVWDVKDEYGLWKEGGWDVQAKKEE